MLDVREYVDSTGRSPFTKWLRALNVQAAAKVATALERIADGTRPTSEQSAAAFSNTGSISALVTAFTSEGTANGLSFCSRVARRSASGKNISSGRYYPR